MALDLKGRVAIVTGGNRGIGAGIARCLAEAGADLALNYRKNVDDAKETQAELKKLGVRVEIYQASVDDPEACRTMVDAVIKDFGHIDILVNNAGIASRGLTIAETDVAEVPRVVATHAFGPFYMCHYVMPHMRKQPRGDVIFISSAATRNFMNNGVPYNMGKAAVEALALTLAKEEKPHNTFVNIVAPGLVESEMGRRLAKATRGVDSLRDLDATMPFGHVCQPEDVGRVVRYLCSPENSYVTGERIYVDGYIVGSQTTK